MQENMVVKAKKAQGGAKTVTWEGGVRFNDSLDESLISNKHDDSVDSSGGDVSFGFHSPQDALDQIWAALQACDMKEAIAPLLNSEKLADIIDYVFTGYDPCSVECDNDPSWMCDGEYEYYKPLDYRAPCKEESTSNNSPNPQSYNNSYNSILRKEIDMDVGDSNVQNLLKESIDMKEIELTISEVIDDTDVVSIAVEESHGIIVEEALYVMPNCSEWLYQGRSKML